MKILVITADYPPYHSGGYEIRCKNVVDNLIKRGHTVEIISNRINNNLIPLPENSEIFRELHLLQKKSNVIIRLLWDIVDTLFVKKRVEKFQPEVIYLWHVCNLTRAYIPYIAELNLPIILDEGGSSLMSIWFYHGAWYSWVEISSTNKLKTVVKKMVSHFAYFITHGLLLTQWVWPRNFRVYFNNDQSKNNYINLGFPVLDSPIIGTGLDLNVFTYFEKKVIDFPIVILVPGRIEPQKGQIDSVNLLRLLNENGIRTNLILVGQVGSNYYYEQLEEEIKLYGLSDLVTILPMVDQSKLLDYYHSSDYCFFPSYHSKGLSRIPIEAMASGTIVIAYGEEGSSEVILDGKTGHLVKPKEFYKILDIISGYIHNPLGYIKVIREARNAVEKSYSFNEYMDKIENILKGSVSKN